ncbi:hypothetical protein QE152_g27405 [Popillia japonica]|uniref:Uncharacterized protein n=1 Tax=Popillia japonica TaxID=7064 RepID=A0AAW1JUP5_POPJA
MATPPCPFRPLIFQNGERRICGILYPIRRGQHPRVFQGMVNAVSAEYYIPFAGDSILVYFKTKADYDKFVQQYKNTFSNLDSTATRLAANKRRWMGPQIVAIFAAIFRVADVRRAFLLAWFDASGCRCCCYRPLRQ